MLQPVTRQLVLARVRGLMMFYILFEGTRLSFNVSQSKSRLCGIPPAACHWHRLLDLKLPRVSPGNFSCAASEQQSERSATNGCDCGLLMASHFLDGAPIEETQTDRDQKDSLLFDDYLHLIIHDSHNMFLFSCKGWDRNFPMEQMVELCLENSSIAMAGSSMSTASTPLWPLTEAPFEMPRRAKCGALERRTFGDTFRQPLCKFHRARESVSYAQSVWTHMANMEQNFEDICKTTIRTGMRQLGVKTTSKLGGYIEDSR
eukprot:s444_g4.t1